MTASESESGKDIRARGAAGFQLEATGGTGFVGGTVDVDVTLSGLPSASSPALGAYDIRVGFDSSQLTFQSVTFSDSLGEEGAGEVITQNPSGMGFVDGGSPAGAGHAGVPATGRSVAALHGALSGPGHRQLSHRSELERLAGG